MKQLLSLEIAIKWKRYRSAHYGLYKVTNDIDGYIKSMKTHQTIIKNWMEAYNEKLIEAVTNICLLEPDARFKIKYLSAGYDLANGDDYTTNI